MWCWTRSMATSKAQSAGEMANGCFVDAVLCVNTTMCLSVEGLLTRTALSVLKLASSGPSARCTTEHLWHPFGNSSQKDT